MCSEDIGPNNNAIKKSLSKDRAIMLVKNPIKGTVDGNRDLGILPQRKVNPDPAAERAAAEASATQDANARIALQRKAMRENSLLTGAGTSRATLGV
jgi:hypothetical protein